MYEVAVRRSFTARHRLRGYAPDDGRPHRHRWEVRARARTTHLAETGFGLDFTEFDRWLDEALNRFENAVLNEVEPFDRVNPSAENVARWVYESLAPRVAARSAELVAVEVREGPRFTATYRPDAANGKQEP